MQVSHDVVLEMKDESSSEQFLMTVPHNGFLSEMWKTSQYHIM